MALRRLKEITDEVSERLSQSYLDRKDLVYLALFFILTPTVHELIHAVALVSFKCTPVIDPGYIIPLFMVPVTSPGCSLNYYQQLAVAMSPYAIEVFLGIIFLLFSYYNLIVHRSDMVYELSQLVSAINEKSRDDEWVDKEAEDLSKELDTLAGRRFLLFGMLMIADVVISFTLFALLGIGEDWAYVWLRP